MDWMAWTFSYAYGNSMTVAMWSTFALAVAFAVLVRRWSWAEAAFFAGFTVFVVFSVMLTVYNGIRSTSGLGSMFLIACVTIVAFPTAGIVRLVMRTFRKPASVE